MAFKEYKLGYGFLGVIEDGSYVLILAGGKSWLVKVVRGRTFHTHLGYLDLGSLIGLDYGSEVETSSGHRLYVMKPTIFDLVMKLPRKTQIVYPKDMGLIALKLGLGPGMKVLEAGTGSGALTIFLANLVRPDGHVYTYEVRREFIRLAKRNVGKAGLSDYVTFVEGDARDADMEVDALVLDVPDPWDFLEMADRCLKGSGGFASVLPTIDQAEKLVSALKEHSFTDVSCYELLARRWEARIGMSRPSSRMVGHTAFLVFARKVLPRPPS